jgi:predicted Zn-dependent protease
VKTTVESTGAPRRAGIPTRFDTTAEQIRKSMAQRVTIRLSQRLSSIPSSILSLAPARRGVLREPRRASSMMRILSVTMAALIAGASVPARAQQARNLPVIRDAEAEQLLRDYTKPILKAAGLASQNIKVVIINNKAFNAFVADGHRIFVNIGALTESKTPNQIIGVLAHETGHIVGGHLARMRDQVARASTQSIIALLLGVGAMVAASRSGNATTGNIGAAALTAPQMTIQRSLIAYQRSQEESADRAGVRFLTATHQSAKGMYETFKRFADQELFASRYVDPYLQSHPMSADRVAALEGIAKTSPYWNVKDPPALQARHDLMRAKLIAFTSQPNEVVRRYPFSDDSLAARYARAIAAYRYSSVESATRQIDSLIQSQPNNPYFYELKGQALLERGKAAQAIAPLRKSVHLAPSPALIQILLAQALIATNNKANAKEAVGLLNAALAREPESPNGYTQLAMAYGQEGDYAHADLASAKAAAARGDMRTARDLANRAKSRFPIGSPGWVKADDIIGYKSPAKH